MPWGRYELLGHSSGRIAAPFIRPGVDNEFSDLVLDERFGGEGGILGRVVQITSCPVGKPVSSFIAAMTGMGFNPDQSEGDAV